MTMTIFFPPQWAPATAASSNWTPSRSLTGGPPTHKVGLWLTPFCSATGQRGGGRLIIFSPDLSFCRRSDGRTAAERIPGFYAAVPEPGGGPEWTVQPIHGRQPQPLSGWQRSRYTTGYDHSHFNTSLWQVCRCVIFPSASRGVRAGLLRLWRAEAAALLLASVLHARLHRSSATPASGVLPLGYPRAILPPCGQTEKRPSTKAGQGGPRHGDVSISRSDF